MEWMHFSTRTIDADTSELVCNCGKKRFRVQQEPPRRLGGVHKNRVVAVCSCGKKFRIKLGTFTSGQATSRMRRR